MLFLVFTICTKTTMEPQMIELITSFARNFIKIQLEIQDAKKPTLQLEPPGVQA